ncbi:hypothetical protein BASA83_013715 [Batrachochytrium salamandrivorans]|nr:hypothetical protein BASA83_013715 [Batrachochytrium salamandrivorans]
MAQERIFEASINQLELGFHFKRADTTRIEKMIAMLGTLLLETHSHGTIRTWRNPISSGMIFRLGQGSREKFRATFGEVNQEQVSVGKTSCIKTRKPTLFIYVAEFRQLTGRYRLETMLLFDRSFITVSAVRLRDALDI